MWRLKTVFVGFLILFLSILGRLFYWQVIRGEELSAYARSQQLINSEVRAKRGEILASDGSWLAASVPGWEVTVQISKLGISPGEASEIFAEAFVKKGSDSDQDSEKYSESLKKEKDRIYDLLTATKSDWRMIKNKVKPESRLAIENSKLGGLSFTPDEIREYPEASVAAHVLGFVGKDDDGEDRGYFGLEGYYDIILSGKPGFLSRERDAFGVPIASLKGKKSDAIVGTNLLTNIDKGIQLTLDEKLKKGVEKYQAASGLAIVMNPKTGAILAMSAEPGYDPADYRSYDNSLFLNPIVSSSFEPGSIFKVVVMASALSEGVVDPDTKCDICSGPVRIDGYDIETWNRKYRPDTDMTGVIVNSDNTGMVFAARRLGKEKLFDYIRNFGFGEKTGVDLQGEASPGIRDIGSWKEIDLATASFGQGIAVTPIQMIRAVGAIANKGFLTQPKVVNKLVGEDWESEIEIPEPKRIITEKAAMQITSMMAAAAENGEAKWTYKKGFKVAGKTGTAQIPISGHYDEEKTAASFVGFAPFNDPKFVMLVTLFEPQSSPWASETAAPLWYDIAGHLFLKFGIHPDSD